jgi:hypothetical protein
MANGMPSSDAVAKMESTPVCGVEMRKDTVAPFDAPSRYSDVAVGITPHEQSGSGMPNRAAHSTERKLLPASLSAYMRCGTNSRSIPATRKPNSRYGVISLSSPISGSMYLSILYILKMHCRMSERQCKYSDFYRNGD